MDNGSPIVVVSKPQITSVVVELENSRVGVGVADGTATTPSIQFKSVGNTGFYKSGTGIGATVGGVSRANVSSGGLEVNGSVKANDGSVSTPAFTFNSQTGTGFYKTAGGALDCSIAGTSKLEIQSSAIHSKVVIATPGLDLQEPSPAISFPDGHYLYSPSTNVFQFSNSSDDKVVAITNNALEVASGGTLAQPSLRISDAGRGFYTEGVDGDNIQKLIVAVSGGASGAFVRDNGLNKNYFESTEGRFVVQRSQVSRNDRLYVGPSNFNNTCLLNQVLLGSFTYSTAIAANGDNLLTTINVTNNVDGSIPFVSFCRQPASGSVGWSRIQLYLDSTTTSSQIKIRGGNPFSTATSGSVTIQYMMVWYQLNQGDPI